MAKDALTENVRLLELTGRFEHDGIDRETRVITGVKVLGRVSENGSGTVRRSYSDDALKDVARLLEGGKVYFGHDRDGRGRGPDEYVGRVRELVVSEDGVRAGKLEVVNPRHWDLLEAVASRDPEAFGMSIDAVGSVRSGVVERVTRARSTDLVTDPATTRSLFESRWEDHATMRFPKDKGFTLESAREWAKANGRSGEWEETDSEVLLRWSSSSSTRSSSSSGADGVTTITEQAEVQSLVFDKEKFKTSTEAKKWAKEHDFKGTKVDETDDSFRLRQSAPSGFKRFRTKSLAPGVKAVIGISESAVEDDKVDMTKLTIDQLREERADLVEAVIAESTAKMKMIERERDVLKELLQEGRQVDDVSLRALLSIDEPKDRAALAEKLDQRGSTHVTSRDGSRAKTARRSDDPGSAKLIEDKIGAMMASR